MSSSGIDGEEERESEKDPESSLRSSMRMRRDMDYGGEGEVTGAWADRSREELVLCPTLKAMR